MAGGGSLAATFSLPEGITTDGTSLFVADTANNQIRQISLATGNVTLLAGSPTGVSGMTNGTGTAATFFGPTDITTDGTNLYVADANNNQIRKIVIATGAVTLVAGSPAGTPGMANGTGTAATFNGPVGITMDKNNLYVADFTNNQVRQIVIATGVTTVLAGGAAGTAGMANGTGSGASFNGPSGVATDGTNVFVADQGNNQVRQIVIASGVTTLLAGSTAGTSGKVNGTGTGASFFWPGAITSDGTNLYVSDTGNNQIRKVVIAGGVTSFVAGSATGAAGMANGTGTAASFNTPYGLVTVGGTTLYVCDAKNNQIRQIK